MWQVQTVESGLLASSDTQCRRADDYVLRVHGVWAPMEVLVDAKFLLLVERGAIKYGGTRADLHQ